MIQRNYTCHVYVLDVNKNFEIIRNLIKDIFNETHVKIVVHNLENNEIKVSNNFYKEEEIDEDDV